ncbi:MAG: ubiquinone biosynthesis protein [Lachnospiraceae bacterium]|nr:ubiquinone biosynthesis protein [Lachnospiraceae bacterium]
MRKITHYLTVCSMLVLMTCFFCACNKTTASTSGSNNTDKNDFSEDLSDATNDIAEGARNATDDLLGDGGFDNYADAHDYFLDTMGAYHSDAKFELRNEDKKLNDYQEGSMGYHFYLYDTSKNADGEEFGEFFVDANSGRIYRKTETSIEEYPVTSTTVSDRNGSVVRNARKLSLR